MNIREENSLRHDMEVGESSLKLQKCCWFRAAHTLVALGWLREMHRGRRGTQARLLAALNAGGSVCAQLNR